MTVLWAVRLRLAADAAEEAEQALDPFAIAVSRYEVEGGRRWEVEALIQGAPDRAAVRAAVASFGTPEFAPLPAKDWVAETQRSLPPIIAGRFQLRGSHVQSPVPKGRIPLLIDAGAAFGTGRHETTKGCLIALGRLARAGYRFRRMLDLGCGSGVLALASAKLWPGPVLAADNDPVAVRVTRENATINGLARRIEVRRSRGYGSPALRRAAPFDLIIANILARPLIRLAPGLDRHLAPGGIAVLSGLLTSQAAAVLDAHLRCGLKLDGRLAVGDWTVLMLRKPPTSKAKRRPRGEGRRLANTARA